MKKQSILYTTVLVFLHLSGITIANLMGYVGKGRDIYLTDFKTGQQSQMQLSGLSEIVDYFESFAVSPIDGDLYAVGHWSTYLTVGGRQIERSLYKIDPRTGDVSNNVAFLSASHGLSNLPALAISSDDTPYAIELRSGGDLYALVDTTGPDDWIGVTHIGQTPPAVAFAIDSIDKGILWSASPYAQQLRFVDLSNATTTEIGEVTGPFSSMDYGPDGNLYAWGNKTLYRIDIGTLTAIELGSFALGDSPFALVPEPATILLLGIGFVVARKRKSVE